jgi:hypothetical protein
MPLRLSALIGAVAIILGSPRAHAQDLTMADVLKNAAAYVAQFQQQLSGIASEETYVQEMTPLAGRTSGGGMLARRTLKSDLVLVKPADADRYVEFRDVFEVDGKPVRPRGERLTELLREPWSGRVAAIINESAQYNIGPIQRNVNTPLLAMLFLDASFQAKFEFKRASKARTRLESQGPMSAPSGVVATDENPVFRASTEMWTVEFEEKQRQTIIRTPDGRPLPVRGRFWINPATGAVLISEMVLAGGGVNTTITVSYQSEPLMGFLVPVEMRESYIGARERVVGSATYGRFRPINAPVP